MTYLLFKFLHIVFAIVWVGGMLTLAALSLLVARTADRRFLASLAQYNERIVARLVGPSAGLTLLTGFAAMGIGRTGFSFWILYGIGVFVASLVIGAVFLRRAGMALGRLLAQPDADEREVRTRQRRMALQQMILVVLLLTAVWAMVFKPAL